MNTANYSGLNIGVQLVKHFPHMNTDREILYGVNTVDSITGVEVIESADYNADFFIFCYVDQLSGKEVFGICYTVPPVQNQDAPVHIRYNEFLTKYGTLNEAESALAQMINQRAFYLQR